MTNILFDLLQQEKSRQETNIELIASENFVSKEVMALMGSEFTNKYAEGYPHKRYYGGCEVVDKVEELAQRTALDLFRLSTFDWGVNVQPHSGSQANMAAYMGIFRAKKLPSNAGILAMSLDAGGHLTHGSPVSATAQQFNFAHYGVDDDGYLNYAQLEEMALTWKPAIIVAGASAYSREIDFKAISEIAKSIGAVFMVDMAHIAGLIVGGEHVSPFPYADVVTTTTHKTLRGPRGGAIFMKKEFEKDINFCIFPGTQGGPLMNVIAAKAQCFMEAKSYEFRDYASLVVNCANSLARELKLKGCKIVSDGTDNHLFILDTMTSYGLTGKQAQELLDKSGITTNKNTIPNDTQSPFVTSGIRIGLPAAVSFGFGLSHMYLLSNLIHECLSEQKNVSTDVLLLVNQVKKGRE